MSVPRVTVVVLVLAALVPTSLSAQVDDPFQLRVIDRSERDDSFRDRPYLDWLKSAAERVNIFYGRFPLDPNAPFDGLEPLAYDITGNLSLFDPTFQRHSYQVGPNDAIELASGEIAYFLIGPSGSTDPTACGFGGSLGQGDADGDGVYEDRPYDRTLADICTSLGRNAQGVGSCAAEFVEEEMDQNGTLHLLEGNPESSAEGHRCQVVLLTLSAMWCGPCQAQADTAEAFFQEYRDPDGDGDDDFVAIEVLIEDENGAPADSSDCGRWANAGWSTGRLTFPILADGNYSIWSAYNQNNALPTNVVIGPDFVIDYRGSGWNEPLVRDIIETNLCEVMPSGTTVGDTVCP